MAFIEEPGTAHGALPGVVASRRVAVWEPQSETFFDEGSVLTFKLTVEAAGHDRPEDFVKGVRPAGSDPAV